MLTNIARCAVISAPLTPFDVDSNLSAMSVAADKVLPARPDLMVFGELSLCGASCGHLLRQRKLTQDCLSAALRFAELYKLSDTLFLLGLPLAVGRKVISAVAVIKGGRIRMFAASQSDLLDKLDTEQTVTVNGQHVPVCIRPVVRHNGIDIAIVPGLDASQCPDPVQADLVASPTAVKADPARDYMMGARISALSRMLGAGLVLCAGGMGESTYHGIYKNLGGIFENGAALGFQYDYEPLVLVRDIDLDLLPIKQTPAVTDLGGENLTRQRLNRHIAKNPLLPEGNRERILDDMADTQIHGLATRMKPSHLKKMVIGVSGGIDSTHALLVCAAVCDRLGMERSDIIAVLMPGFGTKAGSRNLSEQLAQEIGATIRVVSIADSVNQHFKDISHDPLNLNATYENAQARERTQILFDIAGDNDGLVVGTGDLSEITLGWCTFGGDHLSGYNVNASLTKCMVTEGARALARRLGGRLPAIVGEIADAPPSPELLPGDQVTQNIIGPYELHDFFLYYFVRHNMAADKIVSLALQAFEDTYEDKTVRATFEIFRRRFLTSQFKRGCAAEGVLFGEVCLSPMDYHFPSDLPTVNF